MAILANPDPIFQPAMRIISSISNGFPAVVTTTFANQYITGMIVRLNVPNGFGMVLANQLYGPIVVMGDTTFAIDIDTRNFDPFLAPTAYPQSFQSATVTAIGEVGSLFKAAERNILPFGAS